MSDFEIPCTLAQSVHGISRQEYWSGSSFPSPGAERQPCTLVFLLRWEDWPSEHSVESRVEAWVLEFEALSLGILEAFVCISNSRAGETLEQLKSVDKLPWSLRGARCPSLICTSGKETVQRNELLGRNVQIKRWPLCSSQDLVISLETCYTLTSVTWSCLTLCDPMGCSTPGFPVHHQLLELVQTHVH